MNKNLKIFGIIAFAFVLGLSTNNFANSRAPASYKVAVVDVQKLVASSNQVKALKKEQLKNIEDMKKFVETAKADVDKQSTEANKAKLADKYQATLLQKRKANAETYNKKLAEIDKKISEIITKKAQTSEYDLVLAKGTVLYGGEDITAELTKEVNKK